MALETIGSGALVARALRRLSLVADLEAESAMEDKGDAACAWPCANRMVRNVLRSGWSPWAATLAPGLPASDDWTDMGW